MTSFYLKTDSIGGPHWFAAEISTEGLVAPLLGLARVIFDAYPFETRAEALQAKEELELSDVWFVTEGSTVISDGLKELLQ